MIPSKIKIESFAERCHMGTLGGKGLNYHLVLVSLRIAIIFRPGTFSSLTIMLWYVELNWSQLHSCVPFHLFALSPNTA